MAIIKSIGVTPTERFLAALCEQSFLKLWSYPNPFRDDGKELCDLLVVFENHIFIFFDRENNQLQNSTQDSDVSINWQRWKKNTIDEQTRSVRGAERYIKSKRSIFLDKDRKSPFPINIDPNSSVFHKIIVAHGAKEACERFSGGTEPGSLSIVYQNSDEIPDPSMPFMILLNRKTPIHLFDSNSLPIILGELDTVADLSAYMDAKIMALSKFDLIYTGEEDLLAHYFCNFDSSTKRHFIGSQKRNFTMAIIPPGEWERFKNTDAYKRKKHADQKSYLWDDLLQRTCQNALDGALVGNGNLAFGQSAIFEMAKEPRYVRRVLSEGITNAIRNFPESRRPLVRQITFMDSFYTNKAYVFLQLKADESRRQEIDYREKRIKFIEVACGAAKNKFKHLEKIIGIS